MIHLHNHSHYSVLDGLGKIPEIVARAKELGAPAAAISDHASITGMPELFKECQAAGIRPIIGCEFYVVDKAEPEKGEQRYHLTAWAKTWAGVESLMDRLTLANRQFYHRPRLTWEQALELKGCVIGTACSHGLLIHEDWWALAQRFQRAFGGDFYAEVMPFRNEKDGVDIQAVVNQRALEINAKLGVELLATNDAHYVRQDDFKTHEILLAIQTGATLTSEKRFSFGPDPVFFMRSIAEMQAAFEALCFYIPAHMVRRAILNTAEVARKCDVKMPKFDCHLPNIYEDHETNFKRLVLDGWRTKIEGKGLDEDAYRKRLLYEIQVIQRLGFLRYFLVVEDIIRWARAQGIMVGPARGSSAGSLVCYLLDITQIDPIRHGLFFERFLNPERIDLPDIDVDFQDTRREEVFAYIRERYGADCTAHINTLNTLGVRGAFRDVARVCGVGNMQVNVLSRQIEDIESFEKVPDLIRFAKAHPEVVEQAKKLDGVIRAQGVHACGIVVSGRPLGGLAAMERRKDKEVVNWDMKKCEAFGLLKIDVLGLGTLSVLQECLKLVRERHGVEIVLTEIPLDDEQTLAAFERGEGVGVFQFEHVGMRNLLQDVKARDFATISAVTALFRPGSLNSGQTATYVKVAKGFEYERYECEALQPILGETLGVLVYQEQIMRVFHELAGFTWAEADRMRKIIGKKLGKDEFEKHREHFVRGCEERGVDKTVSEDLFDKMVEFAAYSFNKSHAVAYTTISYWSMYLKVHYPLEFLAASLNGTFAKDDRFMTLVRECARMGIQVRRPDINTSGAGFAIDGEGRILAPLGIIKGVGSKAVDDILAARGGGVFLTYPDFKERVNRRLVNIRVQELLVRAGAFESLGYREPDPEKRNKNFVELLPIFNMLPSLERRTEKMDAAGQATWDGLVTEGKACAALVEGRFMQPRLRGGPDDHGDQQPGQEREGPFRE